MKSLSLISVLCALALICDAQLYNGMGPINGYVPMSTPYSNPLTLATPIATIATTPDCTVRPQTVLEIEHMRREASRIATQIEQEVLIMNKRKTYVEQMTNYLNDRIRELNKVKTELAAELKWIELSNNRIQELAEKEKLVKLQDVLSCLSQDQTNAAGENAAKAASLASIRQQSTALQTKIAAIQNKIKTQNGGVQI